MNLKSFDIKDIRYFISSVGFPILVAAWLLYERYILLREILKVLIAIKTTLQSR